MSIKTTEGESASNDEICNINIKGAFPISDVSHLIFHFFKFFLQDDIFCFHRVSLKSGEVYGKLSSGDLPTNLPTEIQPGKPPVVGCPRKITY